MDRVKLFINKIANGYIVSYDYEQHQVFYSTIEEVKKCAQNFFEPNSEKEETNENN